MKELYVFSNKDVGRIKIGISDNVNERRRNIENQSGCKLELVYRSGLTDRAESLEAEAHEYFKTDRHLGEWFFTAPEDALMYCSRIIPNYSEDETRNVKNYIGDGYEQELYDRILSFAKEYGEMIYKPKASSSVAKKARIALDFKNKGLSIAAIARELSVSRQTVYSYLEVAKDEVILKKEYPGNPDKCFADTSIDSTQFEKDVTTDVSNEGLKKNRDAASQVKEQKKSPAAKSNSLAKIVPKGKGVRIAPNVYKYDNCFTYERLFPGKAKIVLSFINKEDAIAASK